VRAVSIAVISIVCGVIVSPALAQKERGGAYGSGIAGPQVQIVISDRDRAAVRSYYYTEYNAGHCPPGLAKKGNGCLPPGQAKKMWAIGQPLLAGVAYYPLPPALYRQLTPPPPGHDYVRVADDILVLAVGSRLVVGALADLGMLGR
jgi:hypothetical protein